MKRKGIFIVVLLFLLPLLSAARDAGVAQTRIDRLAKGVNVTRWFWLSEDTSAEHYRTYLSDAQMQAIRSAGFRHVRLPIEPKLLLDEYHPTELDADLTGYLKDAVRRFIAHDLAVIVDIHAWEAGFKDRLMTDTEMQRDFALMWQTLAEHLRDLDSDKVFFEVMNEPAPDDSALWPPIQAAVVQAIRTGAPEHTIIVGGANWNSIDGLLLLEPLSDSNIVYNFHFYDPFIFTHQGATWAGDTIALFRGISYPSTEGRCGQLPDFKTQAANDWANWYCNDETWDAAVIDQRVKQAADWAAQYSVPVTVNEFGVYPVVAPYRDRLQWFEDARASFERYGIGWSLWGYDDAFGLAYSPARGMDESVLKALGMQPSN